MLPRAYSILTSRGWRNSRKRSPCCVRGGRRRATYPMSVFVSSGLLCAEPASLLGLHPVPKAKTGPSGGLGGSRNPSDAWNNPAGRDRTQPPWQARPSL